MKNLRRISSALIMLIAMAVIFNSCEKETLPTAAFTFAPETVVQYDMVQFTSTSTDADSYLWDFGGGVTSTEANPSIQFLTAGTVTVTLTATNGDGSNSVEQTITVTAPDNHYMLDATKFAITTDFFWYSAMGSTYLRLLTDVTGQDNPDLIKLYPNMGLNELPGTYTWDNDTKPAGTYNYGYTADYAGMAYEWTGVSKTGSTDLVIEEVDTGIYKITGTMTISAGNYNADWTAFIEESTKILTISYIGVITPLP